MMCFRASVAYRLLVLGFLSDAVSVELIHISVNAPSVIFVPSRQVSAQPAPHLLGLVPGLPCRLAVDGRAPRHPVLVAIPHMHLPAPVSPLDRSAALVVAAALCCAPGGRPPLVPA